MSTAAGIEVDTELALELLDDFDETVRCNLGDDCTQEAKWRLVKKCCGPTQWLACNTHRSQLRGEMLVAMIMGRHLVCGECGYFPVKPDCFEFIPLPKGGE